VILKINFHQRVHPNAHSYGDIDDTDLNMEFITNEREDNSHDWTKSEWHKNYRYKEHRIRGNYDDDDNQNGKFGEFEELFEDLKKAKVNGVKKADSDEMASSSVNSKVNASKNRLTDEEVIDLFEDEWTFKDLDLWFVG